MKWSKVESKRETVWKQALHPTIHAALPPSILHSSHFYSSHILISSHHILPTHCGQFTVVNLPTNLQALRISEEIRTPIKTYTAQGEHKFHKGNTWGQDQTQAFSAVRSATVHSTSAPHQLPTWTGIGCIWIFFRAVINSTTVRVQPFDILLCLMTTWQRYQGFCVFMQVFGLSLDPAEIRPQLAGLHL